MKASRLLQLNSRTLSDHSILRTTTYQCSQIISMRSKSGKAVKPQNTFLQMIKPVKIEAKHLEKNEVHVGTELCGLLDKDALLELLNSFFRSAAVKSMALQQGMEGNLFRDAFTSFRKFCAESSVLPNDFHVIASDLLRGHGSLVDVFPFFLRHARKIYPHLDCLDDLRHVSDLTQPANWFPQARSKPRKIIIHAGPTNSGKTHHAFQRFLEANSGIYCGPLKMLAVEICNRSNHEGVDCDLVTGEERKLADPAGRLQAAHVACTVEMTSLHQHVEVAIIDEIQMLRDPIRGWAWTRALLGIHADEVHVCGEDTAIDIIKEISVDTGDEVEVRRYKRLTPIEYMRTPVESFENVQDGDCIVCFNKNHIYHVSRELEKLNRECAVIYGSLPPGTKLAQAARFNNPSDPCKVLVATDAIGMGLNLNIRRIVFYSLMKMSENVKGEKEVDVISPSQALQIAGRCGRFGTTHHEKGYVTCFKMEDISLMHDLLSRPIDPIDQAGLHPVAEQIELFAYHLPHTTLASLIDIFVTLSTVDMEKYFLCNVEPFKDLSAIIEHVPMSLRNRYLFCCAPINLQSTFVTSMFLKYARQFSIGNAVQLEWVGEQIGWPFTKPKTLSQLTHLEAVHDVLDLYQWLSYRFEDQFPDRNYVKDMQAEIDALILEGVNDITHLIDASDEQKELLRNDDRKQKYVKLKGTDGVTDSVPGTVSPLVQSFLKRASRKRET